jgi:hypothetical protein
MWTEFLCATGSVCGSLDILYPEDGCSIIFRNVGKLPYHIPGLTSIYSCWLFAWISFRTDDGGSLSLRNIGELPDHSCRYCCIVRRGFSCSCSHGAATCEQVFGGGCDAATVNCPELPTVSVFKILNLATLSGELLLSFARTFLVRAPLENTVSDVRRGEPIGASNFLRSPWFAPSPVLALLSVYH